jgi:hypothetical protein
MNFCWKQCNESKVKKGSDKRKSNPVIIVQFPRKLAIHQEISINGSEVND